MASFHYDVIVIGGGASGMMAAGRAGELGKRVLLLEKNSRLGEKLRISGGGRCNILNAEHDEKVLLKKYGKAEQFLYSTFAQFGMRDTYAFFESQGLPLVVEAHNRAFPHTHKAEDVVSILEAYMRRGGVTIKTKSPVHKILFGKEGIEGVQVGVHIYVAQDYILSTGGVSHKETGSTGDGFGWLESTAHIVKKPTPSIVPLHIKESWVHHLAGVAVDQAKVNFFVDEIKQFSILGKILFTHFGLSGPVVLNHAQKVHELLHTGTVTATIDLFPKVDHGTLEKEILTLFDAHKNKELKNVIGEIVPDGLTRGVSELIDGIVPIKQKVHSVTKEERKRIMHLLKAMPLTVLGLMGFDRAVVADGGVSLTDIDMKTMRSKKMKNLFVVGDMLDINRPSGGYSLQLCWTTGCVAGSYAGS